LPQKKWATLIASEGTYNPARATKQELQLAITIESLKVVSYLKTEHLGDGRTVKLMPLWDGTNWRMWVDTPVGLIEGKMMDTIEGDYVGVGAAKEFDLFIPFVHLMWQRASWTEVCPLISAISDDFHNMGTFWPSLSISSTRNALCHPDQHRDLHTPSWNTS